MKRTLTYRNLFLGFVALYVGLFFASDAGGGCHASAAIGDLNYCLVTNIAVTNDSAVAMTDQPVRVLLPAVGMINSNQMDARAWDAFPIVGSANNEVPLLAQSLTSSQAPFWFTVPSIPAGATREIQMFTGASDVRRTNGIRFTGREKMTVAHSLGSALQGTDHYIEVALVNHDSTVRTNTLVDKYLVTTNDLGFKLEIVDQTTHNDIVFTAGNTIVGPAVDTCAFTWDNAWNDTRQIINVDWQLGNNIIMTRNGVVENTCNPTEDLPGNTAGLSVLIGEDQAGGQNLTGVTIESYESWDNGLDDVLAQLRPGDITETNSINPYSGTIDNLLGPDAITYEIDADQSDITFSVDTIAPNLYTVDLNVDEGNSVVGAPVVSGFENARPAVSSGVIYDNVIVPLQSISASTGAPEAGVIAALLYAVSTVAAIFVYKVSKGYLPVAIMVLGIGPTLGVVLGYVPEWSLLIWGLTVAVVWFAQLRSQQVS